MHPDLSPHLHTPECNVLIEIYHKCHADHPFKKFIGTCNKIDSQMLRCLKAERIERRRLNSIKAKEQKARIYGKDTH